jgi:hypothetical protein
MSVGRGLPQFGYPLLGGDKQIVREIDGRFRFKKPYSRVYGRSINKPEFGTYS